LFTPNQVEAAHFAGRDLNVAKEISCAEMATSILASGCNGVALKIDSQLVFLTSAAGDAFNGVFATGLKLKKSSLRNSRLAAGAAGMLVARVCAQPSMPNWVAVQEFMEKE
jgi:ribokinase